MNIAKLFGRLGSATLFLAAAGWPAAKAADDVPEPALAPPSHQPQPLTPEEQELLNRFDKSGTGRLDAGELTAAHATMMQQQAGREAKARQLYDHLIERFDPGHTGRLTPAEQVEAVAYLKQNRPKAYEAITRRFGGEASELTDAQRAALFQYLSNLPEPAAKTAQP